MKRSERIVHPNGVGQLLLAVLLSECNSGRCLRLLPSLMWQCFDSIIPSEVINFCQTYVQFGTIKTLGLNESISIRAPDASSTTQTIVIDWVSVHLAHYDFCLTTISSKYKIGGLVRYLIVTRSSICVNQPELDVP